ncbi:FecR family protein [Flavivirga eckloniae]|uniref:Iron dicitrate transport regulator FecR n=1 Tax=Flavivirga eckloniae TaxID=1803846 RepID=A0A2K9PP20_9FLAO|nr:FecR domain-containing protein [Flavivirga eckloniae]AUP78830.1 iron dicitrate transport regulator FecR [Flavivirga eckloniae]
MNNLINKYLNNTITSEELYKLSKWLQDDNNKKIFEIYLRDQSDVYTVLQDVNLESAYASIKKKAKLEPKSSVLKLSVKKWGRYAAVLVCLVGSAYAIYLISQYSSVSTKINDPSNQITLELEDGSIKVLDEFSSEIITNTRGEEIVNHNKKVLRYSNESTTNKETLVYNQLIVPYGKKFQIVLSDGSEVFLNSGSKLKYPVTFLKGLERNVFLDGEAYFSVVKDQDHPFTVITEEMNTRVYGTKFNVSSYKNESNTSTVLVEGRVGVYKTKLEVNKDNLIMVSPGQKATYESGEVAVEKVDIEKYIAWTKGRLHFVDDRFEVIVKELERHFNVAINNTYTEFNQKPITGTFETETLEQILIAFQAYASFEYKIEGKEILITKPK